MFFRDENKIIGLLSLQLQRYPDYTKKKDGPWSREEKLFLENKTLKRRFDEVFEEKARKVKDLKEL